MTVDQRVESTSQAEGERWPELRLEDWQPTYETLHRWAQIVGKTRLGLSPFENHWWHCALYTTSRGLTTSPMPCDGGTIQIELDFLSHYLIARTDADESRSLRLESKSVADFYHEYRGLLRDLGVHVHIHPVPAEIADATPFAEDREHATYDPHAATRFFRALQCADLALKRFRSGFVGKCSPTHFWWGAFDVACTRFSGRKAPTYAGSVPNCPSYVMVEAYSHECISAGWWPGSAGAPVSEPAFYAYAYPEPAGCSGVTIEPAEARWDTAMREWILPYDAVRSASDPEALVAAFFDSTYEGAASLAGWDTAALRSSHQRIVARNSTSA